MTPPCDDRLIPSEVLTLWRVLFFCFEKKYEQMRNSMVHSIEEGQPVYSLKIGKAYTMFTILITKCFIGLND